MPNRARLFPLWFLAPFIPMVASQVVRLYQTSALGWLLCDYSGRIGALLILAALPAARAVAFHPQPLKTPWWETTLWLIGMPFLYCTFCQWLAHAINHWIPHTRLGFYPQPQGWLNFFDLSFGLLLVSFHEEIVFRRCAKDVFAGFLGNDTLMVITSALLFAAYHWTTGLGNVAGTFIFGMATMLCLRRTQALWPLVTAHFLTDFISFSGMF